MLHMQLLMRVRAADPAAHVTGTHTCKACCTSSAAPTKAQPAQAARLCLGRVVTWCSSATMELGEGSPVQLVYLHVSSYTLLHVLSIRLILAFSPQIVHVLRIFCIFLRTFSSAGCERRNYDVVMKDRLSPEQKCNAFGANSAEAKDGEGARGRD